MGLEPQQLDVRFLAALKAGFPNCSGVALGVDRLLMLAMDAEKLKRLFLSALKSLIFYAVL